jgi:putative restriction endonuclease
VTADLDFRVRVAAFAFLAEQCRARGDEVPRSVLAEGFQFDGHRVPLVGPQGIFKPAVLPDMPLSITTVPVVEGRERPYEDEMSPDGFILYRYRRDGADHRDNVGLRLAMQRRAPLVYLYGTVPGMYRPVFPAYVVGDDRSTMTFTIAVDDAEVQPPGDDAVDEGAQGRRAYITTVTVKRLHQQAFRDRVLRAYRVTCSICRLRRQELLEAAHILPDGHPRGLPVVPNGVALCKLHHAAFDRYIIGIAPDLRVEVRRDVLDEPDGPMLKHGLQEFHRAKIIVPSPLAQRPNIEFLAERYELFRKAS